METGEPVRGEPERALDLPMPAPVEPSEPEPALIGWENARPEPLDQPLDVPEREIVASSRPRLGFFWLLLVLAGAVAALLVFRARETAPGPAATSALRPTPTSSAGATAGIRSTPLSAVLIPTSEPPTPALPNPAPTSEPPIALAPAPVPPEPRARGFGPGPLALGVARRTRPRDLAGRPVHHSAGARLRALIAGRSLEVRPRRHDVDRGGRAQREKLLPRLLGPVRDAARGAPRQRVGPALLLHADEPSRRRFAASVSATLRSRRPLEQHSPASPAPPEPELHGSLEEA